MSRLTSDDVSGIPAQLPAYDAGLRNRIGMGLRGLAALATGQDEEELAQRLRAAVAAVVPMDCGLGVIEGFCEALRAIACHLEAEAFVTREIDVGGLAEAYRRDADLLLAADDRHFIAVNLRTRRVAENSACTALGFAAALELLCGGARGRGVLVLGCGPVGRHASRFLGERGAKVAVHDSNPERARAAANELARSGAAVRVEPDLEQALLAYDLLFDATPAAGFIKERHIRPQTYVSAPGVPLGLSAGALEAVGPRLVHDPLQIGVAVMLAEALGG